VTSGAGNPGSRTTLYPTIYVWYDYNTNDNLATDADSVVSGIIIILGIAKVIFYFVSMVFILLRTKDRESQVKFQKMYKAVIEFDVLPFLFCDVFHSGLVYFYFSRYIIPGREVSGGGFISAILMILMALPPIFIYICKLLRRIFKGMEKV